MRLYINTESNVYHMEPDAMIRGNMLYSDGSSLKTVSGHSMIATTIVGQAGRHGFAESNRPEALTFNMITGFAQLDKKKFVILVDSGNHCLRLLDRKTMRVTVLSGMCQQPGFADGKNAQFNYPWGVSRDSFRAKRFLIVTDRNSNAIREVNKNTGEAVTLFTSRGEGMKNPTGISQNPMTGDFYITSQYAVFRYHLGDVSPALVAGSHSAFGFVNGAGWAQQSLFNDPSDVLCLAGNKVAVSDRHNNRLRVIDEKKGSVTSVCSGVSGNRDGDWYTCQLLNPYSLLVMNGHLYIGEHRRIQKLKGEQ